MSSRPQSQSDVAPPLPQNVDAERSILGAILLDNKYLPVAVEKIAPEDFFHHHHRLIFYCMLEMAKQAVPIELVTIHDALAKEGELEAAGGVPYISALMDGIPSQANVEHYARIVREKSILRDMIHAASAIQQQSFEACEDPGAILEHARKLFADIKADIGSASAVRAHKPAELKSLVSAGVDYFAYPVAARGLVTLLDGAAKAAGKTTLLLTSIAALVRGNLFLNNATKPVRILYVTEEYPTTWSIALTRAGLLDADFDYLTASDLAGRTWVEKQAIIEQNCIALKTDWLVVDTFFAVAGLGREQENDAGSVDEAVAPLRTIAGRLDMALTLTRHTRKSGGTIGESGRGSSALTGAADTILELKRLSGSLFPDRRNLEITGRVESGFFEIELRDGQYILAPDPEVDNSVPEADRLATAISQNPSATFRDLEELTGISRSRLSRVAASKGWHKEGDLWVLS